MPNKGVVESILAERDLNIEGIGYETYSLLKSQELLDWLDSFDLATGSIRGLAAKILLHKYLYYSGNSIITDFAYDAMEFKLKELDPLHPVLSMVGYKDE